jgi:hypothetical protein
MTDKEAMAMALEALETADETDFWNKQKEAITALKERLAQPEQEHPVYSPFISCELWRLSK